MSGVDFESRVKALAARVKDLRARLASRVLGQERLIEDVLVGVLAGGHVLIEGLPGLGKTRLVHSLAAALGLDFARIQFTPDLMPADITGTRIVDEHEKGLAFRFQPGPIFANLVLADEINRATPKTQSALLEAMQEGSVTVGDTTHRLPRPFTVVATQNPIELEGTFPLPEAQLDRFLFHVVVAAPSVDALVEILDATTRGADTELEPLLSGAEVAEIQALAREIACGKHILRYAAEIVAATSPTTDSGATYVRFGASPRAAQAMILGAKVRAMLAGRELVQTADVDACALPALRHRVMLTFEAEAAGETVERLLPGWLERAAKAAR